MPAPTNLLAAVLLHLQARIEELEAELAAGRNAALQGTSAMPDLK
jgi:hypothetical protein